MKYRCLVLDHDDTVVNSTTVIHYPSFCAYYARVRPHGRRYSLEEYLRYNFSPGILPFFTDIVGLTPEEVAQEAEFWQSYVSTRIPSAFDGIQPLLQAFHDEGGKIAVISHSPHETIFRDYRENGLPLPDLVYGWEQPEHQRKPHPWPLQQVMEKFCLSPREVLVLDDLKPGYDMAKSCHVPFAAAGWAYDVPEIEAFMRRNSDFYFSSVADFSDFLLA